MRWLACFLLALLWLRSRSPRNPPTHSPAWKGVCDAATGEPIRKAHVSLESSASGHNSELLATTDDTGHFRFAEVKPDTYRLQAEKDGFLGGGYGDAKPGDVPNLLKVLGGDRLQDLTLRLFPAGAISGRIVDPEGDPLSGYEVVLSARHRRRKDAPYSPGDSTTTNRKGEYRFDGLMPDTYYVDAGKLALGVAANEIPVDAEGKTSKIRELWTFYPAALSMKDAQPVRIESGQEQSGIDIRIQRGPLLTVKGRIASALDSVPKYQVSASVEEGIGWTSESAKLLPNGEFAIELPPGKHTLALMEQTASGPKQVGATEINLADQDVSGVVITLAKRVQVRVRAVVEGDEDRPLTNGAISLIPDNWDGRARNSFTQYPPKNGTYVIDNVPTGRYWVWFNNAPNCYPKSIQFGARVAGWQPIDVAEDANVDVVVTYSRNVARLAGVIEVPQYGPKNSIRVLLISEDARFQSDKMIPAQIDQSLHFSFEHLRPGKYLAFASQEDDLDLWDNEDFVKLLRSEANEIELHEKENATVHLKLIPKEETDRVRQQIGI